jgi:hypothetical protein
MLGYERSMGLGTLGENGGKWGQSSYLDKSVRVNRIAIGMPSLCWMQSKYSNAAFSSPLRIEFDLKHCRR